MAGWRVSLQDGRRSQKEIRLRAKGIRFPGKVGGGKRNIHVKDHYAVIKNAVQGDRDRGQC